MNENKKILGILLIAVVLLIAMPVIAIITNSKGEEIVNNFYKAYNSTEKKIIYLGRPTCSYCSIYKPILDNLSDDFDFEYTYVNTDEITSSQLDEILRKLGISVKSFGTPYTAFVQNGKVIDNISGYVDENSLFAKLKQNGIIENDSKLLLNYIGINEYKQLLKSEEKSVIVLGQTGCSACTSALPVLKEISKEYDIDINYLLLTDLTESEQKEIINSLEYFSKNEWGTPLMLVVSNNKLINANSGFYNKDAYVSFLKTNGIIE